MYNPYDVEKLARQRRNEMMSEARRDAVADLARRPRSDIRTRPCDISNLPARVRFGLMLVRLGTRLAA